MFAVGLLNWAAVGILFGGGIYFTYKSGFFQFTGFGRLLKATVGSLRSGKKDGLSPFGLFSASLAGAAGIGNIIGVAAAMAAGGAGALFWMWVAAFASMAVKYAETFLAVKYKSSGNGYNSSVMSYIKKAFGGTFAKAFSLLAALSAVLMGNLVQVNAFAVTVNGYFGIPLWVCGTVAAVFVLAVVLGGLRRLVSVTEIAVPFVTLLFIATGLSVMVMNYCEIIPSLILIFKSAFSFSSAAGGFAGAGIAAAISSGVTKGIFSNEAGLGSAGLAYGNTESSEPAKQAVWGAFDVFVDTIVISTVTGIVLLVSDEWRTAGGSLFNVFSSQLGVFGSVSGLVCVSVFSLAAIIAWEYYGECCFSYLTKGKYIMFFKVLFSLLVFFGAILKTEAVWIAAELVNALMLTVNMTSVMLLRKEVVFDL